MKRPDPPIKSHRAIPSHWHRRAAAWAFCHTVPTEFGLVLIFTDPGGTHGAAFATAEFYWAGHVWTRSWPRAYSSRWLNRLARRLAHEVVASVTRGAGHCLACGCVPSWLQKEKK